MSDMVSWIIELKLKEGQLDTFKALMTEMVTATQENEAGTLNYEWYLSEDEQSCHVFERYSNSESVMIHLMTFGAKYAEKFLETVDVTKLTLYGNPNEIVRAALANFEITSLGLIGGFAR